MPTFAEIIGEKTEPTKVETEKPITVLICTKSPDNDDSGTVKRLKDECDNKGLNSHIIHTDSCYLEFNGEGKPFIIHNYSDKKKQKIIVHPKNTCAIIRGSVSTTEKGMAFITALENEGIFVINSRQSFNLCNNKLYTTQMLIKNGINCPRTEIISNVDDIDNKLELIGGLFPVVIKTLNGAEGIGVSIADSKPSLISFLQTLFKNKIEVLIQEYLPIEYDVRTIVLNGEILGCMKRNKISGDFRSNASLGAETEKYELSDEEKKLILKATKVSGTVYCGVDTFNVDGKIYVVEINTSPGSKGIEKITGKNIIGQLVKFISKKSNWSMEKTKTVGYIEKIKIFHKNTLVFSGKCKFDTGKGTSASTIHADNIEIDKENGKVKFEIDGKPYKRDYVKIIKLIRYQGKYTERRPVVTFDIEIDGIKMKDVEFELSNRDGINKELHDVLINRNLMIKLGIVIDPSKELMLSENVKTFKEIMGD